MDLKSALKYVATNTNIFFGNYPRKMWVQLLLLPHPVKSHSLTYMISLCRPICAILWYRFICTVLQYILYHRLSQKLPITYKDLENNISISMPYHQA